MDHIRSSQFYNLFCLFYLDQFFMFSDPSAMAAVHESREMLVDFVLLLGRAPTKNVASAVGEKATLVRNLGEHNGLLAGAPSTSRRRAVTTSAASRRSPRLQHGKLSTKFIALILLVLSLFAMIHATDAYACKRKSLPPAHKPKVVLVHGFNNGAWYWFRVKNHLELAGYDVTALDLKASGIDRTHISEVETFEDYNEPLDRFMSSLPEHERVVVVGHSAGGVSITKALIDHSEKVLAAVYVAATMLKSGYLTCHHLHIGVPYFSMSRCSSSCPELPKATCFEKVLQGVEEIPLVDQTEFTTLRLMLARPGPYRAIVTTNFTEAAEKSARVDKVARVYVKTLFDETLVPEQQAAMIDLWPPCEVIAIKNDHDVPVTNPDLLSAIIINATMYL